MKLSAGQLFAKRTENPFKPGGFWPMFNRAWANYCQGTGENVGDKAAMERFRHEQLDACGFASLHDVDKTNGFDAVMELLAQIAGDDDVATYFAVGAERRFRQFLIPGALTDLSELEGRSVGWNYAAKICSNMELGLSLGDCPKEFLAKVFIALDLQRRRLKRNGHAKPHGHHGHEEAA